MRMKNVCAYIRVSTKAQGASGLGLEAQEASIAQYVAQNGCKLLATYREVETAKRDTLANRPALLQAISHARRAKALLVIAKLDRLARSVYVTAGLHRSGVDFVACDNPNANRLTIQILAAVAEDETRRISERTKAALTAYKARGGRLGAALTPTTSLTAEARLQGTNAARVTIRNNRDESYADLVGPIQALRTEGLSLRAIAERLNADGHTTRNGSQWSAVQVSRILKYVTLSTKL
jgi:DNA invertase Pin-like site-specific DNA recombinase